MKQHETTHGNTSGNELPTEGYFELVVKKLVDLVESVAFSSRVL